MTLSAYLAKHRLTQTKFAEKAGIPQCQVSLYVSGERKPGRSNALKIEKATRGKVRAASWDLASQSA